MSRWKVIVSAPYMQPVLDRFRPFFAEHSIELIVPVVQERLEEDELLACIAEADGIICGDDRLTDRVFAAAPRLKVISKWGTGIDSIDREAARRRGISVCYTPNAFSEPVADTVLGYMLAFARRLPWMDRALKSGEWSKQPSLSLCECTIGVVGVGNAGSAVVRRAAAFGGRVLGNDIRAIDSEFLRKFGLEQVSLETLLQSSDFISMNCDLNPTSFHLINATTLAQTKPGAVIINTARGPIVDEPALIEALTSGHLSGAALDVFEHEPLPLDSPLRHMDNVLLAAHNANSSPAAWERVHERTLQNLVQGLQAMNTVAGPHPVPAV